MSEQQSLAPDDGTPTNDPAAALHFAAMALGLAEAREQQGHPLTAQERVEYDRYQNAARAHGHTDETIRARKDAIDAAVNA